MSIMLTIFDVSIIEKRVYGSLCFDLLSQEMRQSKKKYIYLCTHANKYLCTHANKYKQVFFETLPWTLSGIRRVTYVTLAVK